MSIDFNVIWMDNEHLLFENQTDIKFSICTDNL